MISTAGMTKVDGRHHRADVAARAAQRRLGDDADLGLDLRVDQLGVLMSPPSGRAM
jgi:hypothetical protein